MSDEGIDRFAGSALTEEQVRQIIREEMNTRRYDSIVPIPRVEEAAPALGSMWPVDDDLFVWLIFEGFCRQAEEEALTLTEFHDRGEISPEKIPRESAAPLGRPREDFVWRHFEGVAQRPPVSYWLEAEATDEARQDAIERSEAPPYA